MQTPYYEIQESKLDADITLLQNALQKSWGSNTIAACSVKTNSLPWLLHHFMEKGLWGEVVPKVNMSWFAGLDLHPPGLFTTVPLRTAKFLNRCCGTAAW